MKLEEIKKLETTDLKKKLKTYRMGTYVFSGLLTIMFIVSFLQWKEEGFSAPVFMPFFFIPLFAINYITFKKLKKEYDSRLN